MKIRKKSIYVGIAFFLTLYLSIYFISLKTELEILNIALKNESKIRSSIVLPANDCCLVRFEGDSFTGGKVQLWREVYIAKGTFPDQEYEIVYKINRFGKIMRRNEITI